MTLTIGSLFSGIGGLELGLEAALTDAGLHVTTLWQVEIEDYPRAVLAKHWPDADRRIRDVRLACRTYATPAGVSFDAGALPRVDLVCGGFPCQDLSTAGRGAGLSGERSGLWWQLWRILRELRPRFVVLENVAALLVRGLDVVLGALAELGYDAEWCVFGAAEVGAPHLRRRIAIVAHLPDADEDRRLHAGTASAHGQSVDLRAHGQVADAHPPRRAGRRLPEPAREEDAGPRGGGLADPDPVGCCGLPACRAGAGEPPGHDVERRHGFRRRAWPTEPRLGGTADGSASRLDVAAWEAGTPRTAPTDPTTTPRLAACGNAVVPQWAYVVGLRVAALWPRRAAVA